MRQNMVELRQTLLTDELDVNTTLNSISTALRDLKRLPAEQQRLAKGELNESFRLCLRDCGEALRMQQTALTESRINTARADLKHREDVHELDLQREYGMAKLATVHRILEESFQIVASARNSYNGERLGRIVDSTIDQIMALTH